MSRRSPRNHVPVAISHINLNVKAAPVNWLDETYGSSLDGRLICVLEVNNRWRRGLFTSSSSKHEHDRYVYEIAHALFYHHPYYSEPFRIKPRAFAKAIKDRVQTLPTTLAATALEGTRSTRTKVARIAKQVSLQQLRDPTVWTRHRARTKSTKEWVLWQPTLPLELQFRVIHSLLESDDSHPFDYRSAAILCLVNSSWNAEACKDLYRNKVIVSRQSHYTSLFAHSGPLRSDGPGRRTEHLELLVPPISMHSFCIHRAPVERVDFDFGSSHIFFNHADNDTGLPLRQIGRTSSRISTLATCSVPLYQLTLSLNAKTMRLFISTQNPLDKDDIWQDLLAGHVAALRMMNHLEHLILDAELYLVLLPGYFQSWCDNDQWRNVLAALKAEAGVSSMATFFDETCLTTLTFVGKHVPTLAFLARISRAPKVQSINLAGWNQPDISESWAEYVKEDKKEDDPLCNWVDVLSV